MTAPLSGDLAVAVGDAPTFAARLARVQRRFPVIQLAVLIVALIVGIAALPGFGSWPSLRSVIVLAALVGFAALGQTLVVLVGGLDLSVSGFMVAGALMVTQVAAVLELPFGVALAMAAVGSALLGALVGFICHRFEVQPLVVTFAIGGVALGLTQMQLQGSFGAGAPDWLIQVSSPGGTTFGLPFPAIIPLWILVTAVMGVIIHRTPVGRRLSATGANPRAAENSLIRTRRVWIGVFAFSAVAAVFAGVLLAGFAGGVDPAIGAPYLFQSLAAVIVGGTVFGGPGDYLRTVLGALMLTVLSTVLIGLGLTSADQQILYGLVILAAMAIYGREKRLSDSV